MLNVRAAIFDILAILLFALLARIAHNTPEMPLSVLGWLETSWPFLCGTLLGWGVLVLIRRSPDAQRLLPGAIVWVFSVATGLTLWGVRHSAFPHWSFIVVATVMSALLLLGWRAIAGMVARRAR
ncbi:DUF3054 domain-containing protein [Corynebacterium sp. 320]|uniref:DUF3054 domain-containing protein n=1 Tax=Corynebacterium TaxID=1716 RepID=UPI00125CC387|nr:MULTISPECIES: DUF3054 domain-containing protein [Corynebacterium]KAB1503195.1 DUF3054 domain-containing protein [Corynebacterium sp. 320]KAB1550592.1 DUF3054 domain-containing protein [Corynebacterium sp. 321]KAB1550953.1 DUF3054 domain-containing protein [Corynebacterium sp. 319]KAB3526992.1 DUF3054 domain-containing protein [Corynebacterium sp. 250]KAB3538484.1 DUF3054 domain-containing protein [Corynebacterium sp. 366]